MLIISWDCGIRSTAWVYAEIGNATDFKTNSMDAIRVISSGCIDFLDGRKMCEVKATKYPGLITDYLQTFERVDPSAIVLIESHKIVPGAISAANSAVQFCLASHFRKNEIIYMSPKEKNKVYFGIFSIALVKYITGLSGEPLRKKHTRLNYNLFLRVYPQYSPPKGTSKTKYRDIADALMQLYAYICK